MTNFIETPRFPDNVAVWAIGGRGFKTIVTETYGGDEFRNAAWSQGRGEWDFSQAFRSVNPNSANNLASIYKFFKACRGQLYAFRFKDFSDFKQDDNGGSGIFVQLTSTTFQMYKRTAISPLTFDQIIQKPVTSPAVVVTGGTTPVVDYTTGIVTVASGTPTSWTGQYDIPCRFAGDMPRVGLEPGGALFVWDQLKLIEVRNPG